jgi:hypothetical protein
VTPYLKACGPPEVGCDVAADLRLLGRSGIRREEETALADDPAKLSRPEACLYPDAPEEWIERADAREALERDNYSAVERNRPCGEAGPAPAGDECNTTFVAPRDDLGYFLDGLREDHGVGAARDPSRLGLVSQVGRRSAVEDRSRREERAQIASQLSGHVIVTVATSRCDWRAAVKMRCV